MHFNQGYIDFFNQLEKNNNKQWFNDNRKWYELAVREPFKELIDDVLPHIKKIDSGINMQSKDALFRVNRDLRFSTDKKPYKTHMAAGFSRGGKKSQFAGFYLQIGLKHILIGGGVPFLEKETLRKIRIEIGYNGEEFRRIINEPEFRSIFGFIHGETEKKVPKSFVEIQENFPMIANKQFYYGALYKTENWLFKKELLELIIHHFRAGVDFNNFMIKAISNFSEPVVHKPGRKVLEY